MILNIYIETREFPHHLLEKMRGNRHRRSVRGRANQATASRSTVLAKGVPAGHTRIKDEQAI
jgi:hypothetical protein